jgi:hypothetical protein
MTKEELIKKMIDMQKKFTEYEQKDGVEQVDYYAPKEGHLLDGYRQEYDELARKLVDIAHEEVGSKP